MADPAQLAHLKFRKAALEAKQKRLDAIDPNSEFYSQAAKDINRAGIDALAAEIKQLSATTS